MASLLKRGKQSWVSYYLGGRHVRESLDTKLERVAAAKLKQLEYELATHQLQVAGKIPSSSASHSLGCPEGSGSPAVRSRPIQVRAW
jgi:hypothetical protein